MPVEVQNASVLDSVPESAQIQRWAGAALEEVADDAEPPDLCIRVVDEEESQSLNSRFRGVDNPTNVLSFVAHIDVPGENILGDIVICAPVICAEATSQGKSVSDHYAHMVVHGVLHLSGYDHEQQQPAEQMEALEKKILERIGVTDPYVVS